MATATDWAVETVLASKATRYSGTLTLVHRTPGVILAGSGTLRVGEAWGAIYSDIAGGGGGQWFKTEAAARARFDEIEGEPVCVGDRVELHPACDLWMRGARYGEVVRYDGQCGGEPAFKVRMDHQQVRRLVRIKASLLRRVR